LNEEAQSARHKMIGEEEKYWKKRFEKLEDKIDRVLLEYEMKNEDLYQLSSPLPSSVNIEFDVKSLIRSEFVYEMEPELND
jgi:hypothetical protein